MHDLCARSPPWRLAIPLTGDPAHFVYLLSKELEIIVFVGSDVIAWPIAYVVMDNWLRDFAYRIAPNSALFFLVGLAVLAIAASAVGLHVFKAARANPVEALRYE